MVSIGVIYIDTMEHSCQPPFKRPAFSSLPPETGTGGEPEAISTLTDLIRFNAHHNPDHLFCIQSQSSRDQSDELHPGNPSYEGRSVTFRQLEDAVENCVEWLRNSLGSQNNQDEPQIQGPVALYLESDVGLFLHLAALQALDATVKTHPFTLVDVSYLRVLTIYPVSRSS